MTRRRHAPLPGRALSTVVSDPNGGEVVKIEVLPLGAGQTIRLAFEQIHSPWHQGVWLATNGTLETNGETSAQFVLWSDTAPPEVVIQCLESDGLLRFYNVWDKDDGRGLGSLSHTSGMVVEDLGNGWRRYRCNDIGFDPDFEKLVFRICIG